MLDHFFLKNICKHYNKPCINSFTYAHVFEKMKDHSTLLKQIGIQPNDRIVIQSNKKSVNQVSLMLATWKSRGIIVILPESIHPSILPKIKPSLVMDHKDNIHVNKKTNVTRIIKSPKNPNDPALILFTSGSTADPKGVVLSHSNIISNITMLNNLYQTEITSRDRSYSILPWYHCYGLVCELLFLMNKGASIRLPTNFKNPIPEMKWHRPTLLFTVPKMLEKIYKSAWNSSFTAPFLKYYLFGDRLRMMSVGGSYCSPHLLDHFQERFNIPIYQGFGMTETSPMMSLNSPLENWHGSVGKPLQDVKIMMDPNSGEILTRSPSLMLGYLDSIDDTNTISTTIDLNKGWFGTGDSGFFNQDGYLFINGRIKHEYKLSNGKYVNPLYIESKILTSHFISQAVVFPSDCNSFNVCVVYTESVLSEKEIWKEMVKYCNEARLQNYEIPKRVYQLKEPMTVENGLLSLKLETKRQEIICRWKNLISVNKKPNELS